ncbi:MAG: hypothetical protein ACU4EQ_12735 [Candidatus Nitrosoglobus sp.]|jgi:hypothetical protein
MKWTKEKPTEPGWYWWRYDTGESLSIVRIYSKDEDEDNPVSIAYFSEDGESAAYDGMLQSSYLSEIHGYWAGPLNVPEEPK